MRNKGMLNRKNAGQGDAGTDAGAGKHSKKKRCGRTGAGDSVCAGGSSYRTESGVSILKQLEEGIKNVFRSLPRRMWMWKYVPKSDGGTFEPGILYDPGDR